MTIKPTLDKSLDQAVKAFNEMSGPNDLASLLEVPYSRIRYLLYVKHEANRYNSFEIPKKTGGVRTIDKPTKGISILQQKLRPVLDQIYQPKPSAHAFIKGRSVLTNARPHTNSRYVLNVDLEDFYGSINFGRVRGLFISKPYEIEENTASVLAQLLTFSNRLPQGACTSPVISNMIARGLDGRLTRLARRYHCKYSRYADDLTFSSNKKNFPSALAELDEPNPVTMGSRVGGRLSEAIESEGFRINHAKVRMQIRSVRQEVAGVTVNEFPNVRRKFIRQIRAMIHAWKKFGVSNAEREYVTKFSKHEVYLPKDNDGSYFKKVVYGKLAYLKMIRNDDVVFHNLAAQISQVDSQPPKFIVSARMKADSFDVFICHASEEKETVALPLESACTAVGLKAFVDQKYISWGDSITEKINLALGQAKFFVAIISDASVKKAWPMKELNSAIAREIDGQHKILPLIVGDAETVLQELPLLGDKLYLEWNDNPEDLARTIAELKK